MLSECRDWHCSIVTDLTVICLLRANTEYVTSTHLDAIDMKDICIACTNRVTYVQRFSFRTSRPTRRKLGKPSNRGFHGKRALKESGSVVKMKVCLSRQINTRLITQPLLLPPPHPP